MRIRFAVHHCIKAKRKATNQYIIKQYTNPKMIGHKNRFEFLVILVAIALLSVATINNISSTKSGGSHDIITIIINYAHAQTEVKMSIVPGASTLGEKGFSPNPVNIKVGDTVTWVNDDTVFHTVTYRPFYGGETGKLFDSGLSGPNALTTKGKTFSHKFTEKGQYPYFCQLHPTMVGKISVS
ncbi:MAG: plastocyanin/azurin family copper-binding protein [Nitrososphaeraceae archaeon]